MFFSRIIFLQDDVPACHLINPPKFSDLNISSNALDEPKDRHEINHLFTKIGYSLQPDLFEIMFSEAARDAGAEECTVNQFRDVLNDYLSARDFNRENDWLRKRGV